MKRRRAELLVLAGGALFVAVLAASFRPGRKPASGDRSRLPGAPSAEASGEATTLLEGFDFTESVGGKPLMRIKADRTIGYGPAAGLPPNLYAGEKVTLTVFPEDGSPVTVLADKADYDERTRQSRLRGHVRWTDRDGAVAETQEVVFHPASRTLEAPGRVRFTQGSSVLTAPSARYDLAERVLRFAGPVEGESRGAETGGLSKLTARSGLFRRDSGVLELEYPDGRSLSGDRLAADRLELKTGGSSAHPEWARLTGNVRGLLAAEPAAGSAAAARPQRQYGGQEGTVSFDASGKPRALALSGAPALLWEPERRLTARSIEIGFVSGRASAARAEGDVDIESEKSSARANRGTLGFGPGGEARDVTLDGDVRIDAEGRHAEASRAVESGPQGRGAWRLTGDAGTGARVESGGSRLSADAITIDRAAEHVSGAGHARAVFSPDARKKSPSVTFVGDPKKPTYGKADAIALDDARKLATLTGSASLWQENSSLFADEIRLSDSEKTVTAVGSVRAVMTPARNEGARAGEREVSVVNAKRLLYRDADRSARFEGGVSVARGGWRASGAESTARLDRDGGVESVEISGDVRMSDRATGRSGEAQKALDDPRQGKTVLWGSPARVTDASGNRVAGAILTILERGRSVEITAPEGGKTETIHRTQKN
ncbi:MAG TPA: LptA/OstA family protein, partial [Thermoanaerobaculia bacterium]|nr:LptA/OstA family protein [Thermoanaerobaculia bacterium]